MVRYVLAPLHRDSFGVAVKRQRISEIKHGSIREGDTIRVSGEYGDMEMTRKGRVARVLNNGNAWEYTTAAGYSILTVKRDGHTLPKGAKIELIDRSLDTPLFDM